MTPYARIFAAFTLGALCLAGGCVSQPVPELRTNLIVTRAGGNADIQWKSEPGRIYTLLFSDRVGAGAQWKVLPGAEKLRGTGDVIQLRDHPPESRPRYYDLHIDLVR